LDGRWMLLTAALPSFSNPSAEETSRLRVGASANVLSFGRFQNAEGFAAALA
jgi:hypothetical protein